MSPVEYPSRYLETHIITTHTAELASWRDFVRGRASELANLSDSLSSSFRSCLRVAHTEPRLMLLRDKTAELRSLLLRVWRY